MSLKEHEIGVGIGREFILWRQLLSEIKAKATFAKSWPSRFVGPNAELSGAKRLLEWRVSRRPTTAGKREHA